MAVRRGLSASAKLLIGLGIVGLVVIALGVLLARPNDTWFDDLWLEVAKAGVQLLAVGLLGGALTYAWRTLSIERDKEAERRAKIRSELVDLFSLYNDVKAVRRTLRSLGLHPKDQQPNTEDGRFTEGQAAGFHEQMLALDSLQLGFEAKTRQFEQTDFLRTETPEVVRQLTTIERHLNRVLAVWEKGGWRVQAGVQIKPVSDKLLLLFETAQFKANVSNPLREITRIVNKHAFGEASSETRKLVRLREGEEDPDEE